MDNSTLAVAVPSLMAGVTIVLLLLSGRRRAGPLDLEAADAPVELMRRPAAELPTEELPVQRRADHGHADCDEQAMTA